MNKIIKYTILVIMLAFVGFCIFMESRYSTIHMIKSEMTEEKILKEYPEIAITEEDLALEAYILGLPEVQMMIDQSKKEKTAVWVSNTEAAELLSGWVEDRWTLLELACADDSLNLLWIKDGDRNLSYNFSVDGRYPIQKTIGIYQTHFNGSTSVDTIYSNINGVIEKNIFKRQWFYWVAELLENGYRENMFFGT